MKYVLKRIKITPYSTGYPIFVTIDNNIILLMAVMLSHIYGSNYYIVASIFYILTYKNTFNQPIDLQSQEEVYILFGLDFRKALENYFKIIDFKRYSNYFTCVNVFM